MNNERPKPKVQFGISSDADFEKNTWNFIFTNDYAVWAGEFAILETSEYNKLLEQKAELLKAFKNLLSFHIHTASSGIKTIDANNQAHRIAIVNAESAIKNAEQ